MPLHRLLQDYRSSEAGEQTLKSFCYSFTVKIYLDNCSLQRPLDDRSQVRIALEAEAILSVLRQVELGQLELLSSEVLLFEIERLHNFQRRQAALGMLQNAIETIRIDDAVVDRAMKIIATGVKALDALYLASAETGRADYFCTSDDRFLTRIRSLQLLSKPVSPLELAQEVLP